MFNLKDIINMPIHCPNLEDSIRFMEFLINHLPKIKWNGGDTLNLRKLNRDYGTKTCYKINKDDRLSYADYEFYNNAGYKIIEVEDLIDSLESETTKPKSNEPILPKEERFKILSDLL